MKSSQFEMMVTGVQMSQKNIIKGKLWKYGVTTAAIALLIIFQNCSGSSPGVYSNASLSSASTSNSLSCTIPVGTAWPNISNTATCYSTIPVSIASGSSGIVSDAPGTDSITYSCSNGVPTAASIGTCAGAAATSPAPTPTQPAPTTPTLTPPQILTVPWASLAAVDAGCTLDTPTGGPCISAVNRYCAQNGYVSGFGLEEYSTTAASFTCVGSNAAISIATTFTVLETYLATCSTAADMQTGACNAAVHRYCAAAGYVSGFGPVEAVGNNLSLVCTNAAYSSILTISYATLEAANDSCSIATAPASNACNSAVKRYCVTAGYAAGGYGPNENNGTDVAVTCVN
jgi:hypothetical protein